MKSMTQCLRWPLCIPGVRPFQTGISSNGNKSKSTVDVICVPAMLCYPLSKSPQCKDAWTSNTKYQGAALLFIHSALSSYATLFFPTQLPAVLCTPINGEEETNSPYITSVLFPVSVMTKRVFQGIIHLTWWVIFLNSYTPFIISSISQLSKQVHDVKGICQPWAFSIPKLGFGLKLSTAWPQLLLYWACGFLDRNPWEERLYLVSLISHLDIWTWLFQYILDHLLFQ